MKASTSKRLTLVFVAILMFVSYLATRDTIKVEAALPRKDVKAIVAGIQEWSSPKLFRQIVIRTQEDGMVSAWVREPGEHWSVTVFSNSVGVWKKVNWYLLNTDHSVIKK